MPCGAADIVASAPGPGRANSAWRRRSNGGSDDTLVLFKGKLQTGAVLSGHDLPGKVGQSTLQGPQQVQAQLALDVLHACVGGHRPDPAQVRRGGDARRSQQSLRACEVFRRARAGVPKGADQGAKHSHSSRYGERLQRLAAPFGANERVCGDISQALSPGPEITERGWRLVAWHGGSLPGRASRLHASLRLVVGRHMPPPRLAGDVRVIPGCELLQVRLVESPRDDGDGGLVVYGPNGAAASAAKGPAGVRRSAPRGRLAARADPLHTLRGELDPGQGERAGVPAAAFA